MTRLFKHLLFRLVACAWLLSACAQMEPRSWALTPAQRESQQAVIQQLLAQPLQSDEAVQLALLNNASLQALLAQHQADRSDAAQQGQISNPLLSLDKLRMGSELEIGRMVSFGLFDLLTLPQRRAVADLRVSQETLRLSTTVVEHINQVRLAWVKAVAAQQQLQYANQVLEAAQASHSLANKMLTAGNFSKLQYARQQAFELDAQAEALAAFHSQVASREHLVRLLGLNDAQAQSLVLPSRLPDLPLHALAPEVIAAQVRSDRLDVRLAQSRFDALVLAQGYTTLSSYTDIELGVRRDTVFNNTNASAAARRGVEVNMKLPVFDWGNLQRQSLQAQTLAAGYRVEATLVQAGSHVRQAYAAYLNAFELVSHYQQAVLPMRKVISEEQLLRYNGMFLSVFDLLADSRENIGTVRMALAAQEQFWLADAGLQAALMGLPSATATRSEGELR